MTPESHFVRQIELALQSNTLRFLSRHTGIPFTTLALRRRNPWSVQLHELFKMQNAGLLCVSITRQVKGFVA